MKENMTNAEGFQAELDEEALKSFGGQTAS